MSLDNSNGTLGKRIKDALWRRINARVLTRTDLKRRMYEECECSAGTIDNLFNGYSDPSGRVLMGLLAVLDAAFANEILAPTGCTVAKLSDRRAAALKRLNEAMAEWDAVEG